MHPDATGLVQEEVLPAAVPLLIAVPELNLHTSLAWGVATTLLTTNY